MNTQQQTLNERIANIIYAEMEDYYGSETCIPALEKLFLYEQIELLKKITIKLFDGDDIHTVNVARIELENQLNNIN